MKGIVSMVSTKTWIASGAAVLLGGLFPGSLRGEEYKAVPLKASGTIVGVVRFEGEVPKQKPIQVTAKDEPCHKEPILTEDMVVSGNGRIQWAVASIEKIDQGKPFPAPDPENPVMLDQHGCRFQPHVVVVPKDQPLAIMNSDGILHNVHLHARKNEPFNRSMPGRVKKLDVSFERTETIRVGCDVHKWMGAWIVVAEHPYYAVTGNNGEFRLEDVPAGTYSLEVWHEELGKQEKQVTVTPGGDTQIEFVFKQK